jgi:hypothetical protein
VLAFKTLRQNVVRISRAIIYEELLAARTDTNETSRPSFANDRLAKRVEAQNAPFKIKAIQYKNRLSSPATSQVRKADPVPAPGWNTISVQIPSLNLSDLSGQETG